ncbi:MAG: RHS repeat-associated core domain-containing protein, partial [Nitrospirota bacterium]
LATYDLRFGKPLTEIDPNYNTTSYQYDVFGRLIKVKNPNDMESPYGTVSYYYLDFGTVGNQRVVAYATEQSGTGNYIWTETYFDGLGRTIKTRAEGPDSKVIAQQTFYDNMGQVSYASLPYFEGIETPRWTNFGYDPIGRVTVIMNPDRTYVTKSYMKGRTTLKDANKHQKIEEKDVYGRLIKVEEYTGVAPSVTLYATTTYQYDVLGNLTKLTDAKNNQSTMTYDTLSRKTSMTDPDMGYWIYTYDDNGNLKTQKDAKNQTITFTYDALNRVTKKDYPTGTDTVYTYDETTSTNSKGRLTKVVDASGTEKYYYDKLGRITKTIKTVSGVNGIIETAYDALSRTTNIKYPDNEIVSYSYDTGGNLSQITGYAAYSNYNALGQAGTITYANGVSTIYQYYSSNNRLYSITTNSPSQGLQNISYSYDKIGNIKTITDYIDSTRNQTFTYDDIDRLTQAQSTVYGTLTYSYSQIGNMTYNSQGGNYTYPTNGIRPHAVTKAGTNTYIYNANGSMTSGAGRTIAYNYDNMPSSITKSGITTTFVYDYDGQRVKKTASSVTTVYMGKLYECTSSVCTKYIFGGSQKIASKKQGVVNYYHTDHLGSSSIITNSSASKVEEIYYYPYGGTRLNSGSVNVKHKFTGQEEDAETGLYYYGARYYDPLLGRFISADTIVQNPFDPQALNRYSYARNNPLIYTDPSGHKWWDVIAGAVVGGVSAGIASDWDGDAVWKGAVAGAVAGLVSSELSGYVGWGIGSAVGGAAGGATSVALNGGNGNEIWRGAYMGAAYAAIGASVGWTVGNVASYYNIENVYVAGLLQIGSGAVAGGIGAELTGGSFAQGAQSGAIGAAASVVANRAAAKFFTKNTKTGEMSQKQAQKTLTVKKGGVLYASAEGAAGIVGLFKDLLKGGAGFYEGASYFALDDCQTFVTQGYHSREGWSNVDWNDTHGETCLEKYKNLQNDGD